LRQSEAVAFRALIGLDDDLISVEPPLRLALSIAPPAPCGDLCFDAGIAAVVDHHRSMAGLPFPSWVTEPSRVLDEEWLVPPFTDPEEVLAACTRHGIQLAASELVSA